MQSLGFRFSRFLEAGSFRISRIMCGIGLVPQVCRSVRRGLASVAPRCLCRAGVTVGALAANVNDDSNSLHLLCNCRITMSIEESLLLLSPVAILKKFTWGPSEARFQSACCPEIVFHIF